MTKEIKIINADATKSDISCKDGEVAAACGVTQTGDGTWAAMPGLKTLASLPAGFTPVALHQSGSGIHLIAARQSMHGTELYCHPDFDATAGRAIDEQALVAIATVAEITCVAALDNVLAIGTTEGIVWLSHDDGAYHVMTAHLEMPVLQFGLQQGGTLATAQRIVASEGSIASAERPYGDGSSNTHPTAAAQHQERLNISRSLIESYTSTLQHQATSRGYVSQPFMLRYALRLSGGGYLMVSAPMMMLPTVLPPRIGISATEADGKCYITVDLSHNRYFRLRYRSRSRADRAWGRLIAAVDIFVSPEVPTYDAGAIAQGHITDYTQVATAVGGLGTLRGRNHQRGTTTQEQGVFDGHYSEAGDCYIDHDMPESDLRVWYVAPNAALIDQLINTERYYRVASLPYGALTEMETFADVPLTTADFSRLDGHMLMASECVMPAVIPTAMHTCHHQIVVASDRRRMAKPQALSAMAPFYGNAAEAMPPVSVEVYTRRHGRIHRVSTAGAGMAAGIAQHIPRYLWYPDADAFMMVLREGDSCRALPLTADESGRGAYWCCSTASEAEAADIPVMDNAVEGADILTERGMVHTTVAGSAYLLQPEAIDLGCTVRALAPAIRAPRSGQFGQYPLYAFTSGGIYVLGYDDGSVRFTSARLASTVRAHSASVATDADGRVYFCADGALKMIEGAEVSTVSAPLVSAGCDIARLPCATEALAHHGISMERCQADEFFADALLSYDAKRHLLMVGSSAQDFSLAYNPHSGTWGALPLRITAEIHGSEGLLAASHAIVGLGATDGPRRAVVLTRPVKIDHPVGSYGLTSLEVLGMMQPRDVRLMLYASRDLAHWHLAADRHGLCCEVTDASPYRYWRLLLIAELRPGSTIDSLLLHSS